MAFLEVLAVDHALPSSIGILAHMRDQLWVTAVWLAQGGILFYPAYVILSFSFL